MARSVGALGIGLLGLGAGLLVACTSAEERFANHVARGESYAAEGEPRKALLEYQSALKFRPEDAEIHERVGDLLAQQRVSGDALFYYREAYRLDPTRIHVGLKQARLLIASDPARARGLVLGVLQEAPDDPSAHRVLSELALARGELGPALVTGKRAVELGPDEVASWMQLGRVHLARLGRARVAERDPEDALFEEALAAFARADELAGGSVPARLEKARVHVAWSGHQEQAEQAYRDVLVFAQERSERAFQRMAAEAAAAYAQRVGDDDMRRWALRALVSVAEHRLDAWEQLAQLAQDEAGGAEGVYRELLLKRGDDPRAHGVYANFLIRSARGEDAITHLEEALEDGIASPLLWEQLLRMRLHRLRLADARATFVRMVDAYPDDPITRRAEARLALVTGRTARAAEILRELAAEGEGFETELLLARAEQRLGKLGRALAAADRAIAKAPAFRADALERKAEIHFDAREWTEVVAAYAQLVARGNPLPDRGRLRRAVALYELGQPDLGRRGLVRILEQPNPPVDAVIEYSRREAERDPEGARAYLMAAFERDPAKRSVLEELCASDLRQGRDDVALERVSGVIESQRVGPSILLLRAELHSRRGEFDAAEADALRAFEAAPESPEALDLLFRLFVAQGRVGEARSSFEEAERAGLLHSGARLLLGRLALHEGEAARARELFEKVLAENPEMASAQSDLAFALARQGEDLDRALDLAERAQQRLLKNPNAVHRLGYVYLRKGQNEAALAQFRRSLALAEGARLTIVQPPLYYHMGLALQALHRDAEAIEAFEASLALGSDFPDAEDARRQLDRMRASLSARNPS